MWDTCDATGAPIKPISGTNANNQYEFYNYSWHPHTGSIAPNLAELYNDAYNSGGGLSAEAQLYYNDFFNVGGSQNGIDVQKELYTLGGAGGGMNTQQVLAAIQTAFKNYFAYLVCTNNTTGNNGWPSSCGIQPPTCPPTYQP